MHYRFLAILIALFALPLSLSAQAVPTASRPLSLQAGAGISYSDSDYGIKKITGFTVYAGADFGAHFGLEVNVHDLQIITPDDLGESTYLLGLRYKITRKNFNPYVRLSAGLGTFTFDKGYYPATTSAHYHAYTFGGGLDYTAGHKINIRIIDFDYQDWTTFSPHNLTPWVATIGAAYRFP